MADRHGRAIWPGVQGFISCTYTVSHGISPGIATLTIPEQDVSRIAAYGTLIITDGVGTVAIPRCKVIDSQFTGGGGSPRTITLIIADRRWMWKFGAVSGNWNQIDPYPDPDSFPPEEFTASGGPYMPGTYRTADNLLKDCLYRLNEENYIIEPLPDKAVLPFVWDDENPAAAMQSVCDAIGYRIVYRPALDQVAIVPAGDGIPLPELPTVISGSNGIDPPERPNKIQLVGGDAIWNDYLWLEPVTLEANGKVVLLDDASYRPSIGWERCPPPHFGQVHVEHGPEACKLAQDHVWRTFRLKMPPGGGPQPIQGFKSNVGGTSDPILVRDRKQIVFGTQLYGLSKDERGQLRTEPAYIIGSVFYARAFDGPQLITLGPFGNTILGKERIPIRPQIDPARGLVTFDRYLFRAAAKVFGVTASIREPVIYLRTSYRIRIDEGMVFYKFRKDGDSPSADNVDPLCPTEYIKRPDLVPVMNVVRKFNPDSSNEVTDIADNLDDVVKAADYHLAAAELKYQVGVSSSRVYAGIYPFSPDGAIQQVTWKVGGGSPATTEASRNSEHSMFIPPFPERRRREIVQNFNTFAPKPPDLPLTGSPGS